MSTIDLPKLHPIASPLTPSVIGTNSMSQMELTSHLINVYNQLVDILARFDPETAQDAARAAAAAQAAAEAAAANVAEFRQTLTAAVETANAASSTASAASVTANGAAATAAEAAENAATAVNVANAASTTAGQANTRAASALSAAQAAQEAAEDAQASAAGANASAAAAVAAVESKMDKTGGTFTGAVHFADAITQGDFYGEPLVTINGDIFAGAIHVTGTVHTGDVIASRQVMARNLYTRTGIRFDADSEAGARVIISAGAGEGSGASYHGVLNVVSGGSGVDESNKRTAIRGVIGSDDSDAVALSQFAPVISATQAAQADAAAAVAGLEDKMPKSGGIFTGPVQAPQLALAVSGSEPGKISLLPSMAANGAHGIVTVATVNKGGAVVTSVLRNVEGLEATDAANLSQV